MGDDSSIRGEGAELYVQAVLMLEFGLVTAKASKGMPGYDVIAHNLENGKHCKIQVKYRKAINSDGARVKNFGFDFLAYVAGNKGYVPATKDQTGEFKDFQVFIIPVTIVKERIRKHDLFESPSWGGYEEYLNAWHLILSYLNFDDKYVHKLP